MYRDWLADVDGPTSDDLDAITREWPLIESELDLLDAQIRMMSAHGGPSELDWRRLRRAQHSVLRAAALVAAGHGDPFDMAA